MSRFHFYIFFLRTIRKCNFYKNCLHKQTNKKNWILEKNVPKTNIFVILLFLPKKSLYHSATASIVILKWAEKTRKLLHHCLFVSFSLIFIFSSVIASFTWYVFKILITTPEFFCCYFLLGHCNFFNVMQQNKLMEIKNKKELKLYYEIFVLFTFMLLISTRLLFHAVNIFVCVSFVLSGDYRTVILRCCQLAGSVARRSNCLTFRIVLSFPLMEDFSKFY